MITITKERLLTIRQWRETYGPGSNVVLPAEEAEDNSLSRAKSLQWHDDRMAGIDRAGIRVCQR